MPTTFDVADEADLNAALAQIDLTGSSSAPNTAYAIAFSGSVTLNTDLYAINLAAGDTLSIDGGGHVLDGGAAHRGLFAYAGTVSVANLAIDDALASGGSGAGGGAGLGGGLFVASGAAVTLAGVTFAGDSATGGNAAPVNDALGPLPGGGGGLGGTGSPGLGGGGIGLSASDDGSGAGAGIVLGAASGGSGGGGGAPPYAGGPYAGGANGGAGGGQVPGFGATGGGGGIGGQPGAVDEAGGNGGFGGGGGGDASRAGFGDGGFGGGGGTYGNGGFGGGGGNGRFGNDAGLGGFGGGNGSGPIERGTSGPGGGGLGAGGAIFVQQGGSLAFAGGDVSGGLVAGGTGFVDPIDGRYPDSQGSAFGAGLFLQGNGQVTLSASASQTLTIADVIADQTGSTHQTGMSASGDPLSGAGSLRIEGPGTVVLSAVDTYVGGTSLAGTLALAVPGAAGSGDIVFDEQYAGRAELDIDGTTMPSNRIDAFEARAGFPGHDPFGSRDAIDLRGVAFDAAATLAVGDGGTLTVSTHGTSYALTLVDPGAFGLGLSAAADGSLLISATPCFAAGTRIASPGGDRPVEDLRAGDLVTLASGGSAAVCWVGHRRLDLRRHPRPRSVQPVRVRAGCFGDGLPTRDLVLSPEHALFVDGALVPVSALVDGESVVQETWDRVTYHHVELARHAILLAEGLPAESYLDTGNRHDFANGTLASLHPSFAPGERPAEPCAPLVLDGPLVEAARARLRGLARAA